MYDCMHITVPENSDIPPLTEKTIMKMIMIMIMIMPMTMTMTMMI